MNNGYTPSLDGIRRTTVDLRKRLTVGEVDRLRIVWKWRGNDPAKFDVEQLLRDILNEALKEAMETQVP